MKFSQKNSKQKIKLIKLMQLIWHPKKHKILYKTLKFKNLKQKKLI